jgi:hypothetical protein
MSTVPIISTIGFISLVGLSDSFGLLGIRRGGRTEAGTTATINLTDLPLLDMTCHTPNANNYCFLNFVYCFDYFALTRILRVAVGSCRVFTGS